MVDLLVWSILPSVIEVTLQDMDTIDWYGCLSQKQTLDSKVHGANMGPKAQCKRNVTSLLMHWSYVPFALNHRIGHVAWCQVIRHSNKFDFPLNNIPSNILVRSRCRCIYLHLQIKTMVNTWRERSRTQWFLCEQRAHFFTSITQNVFDHSSRCQRPRGDFCWHLSTGTILTTGLHWAWFKEAR